MARSELNANTVLRCTRASSGRLTVADNTNLRQGTGKFSISAWVKPVTASGATQDLVSKWGGGAADCEYRLQNHTTLGFRFITSSDGGTTNGSFQAHTTAPTTTDWFHLVGVVNTAHGTGIHYFYVNNVRVDTGLSTMFGGSTAPFCIGGSGTGSTNPADAIFGPVSIWKGRELQDADAAELYANGKPLYYAQYSPNLLSGLTGHWDMNENTVEVAANHLDQSGNGNHLTPSATGVSLTTGNAATLRGNVA